MTLNPKGNPMYSFVVLDKILHLTFVKIEATDEKITFFTEDGKKFIMCHHQDCCEGVWIEDIVGDLDDLIGAPLRCAEERINREEPYGCDGDTWTYYEFATIKGSVTIRWCGLSNGYYSEEVSLYEA